MSFVRTHLAAARERRAADDGFTLIELLVVVVIIGILVAIAIPIYLNYTAGARDNSLRADVRNGVNAVQACYSEKDQMLPAGPVALTASGPLDSGCSDITMVLSKGTAKLVYTNTTRPGQRGSYTIEAFGSLAAGAETFTYDSGTGVTTQGTA